MAGKSGFNQFLVRVVAFLILVFAALAVNYFYFKEVSLEHPIAWALMPVVHIAIITVLFLFFARQRLGEMAEFAPTHMKNLPYLIVAALFIGARYLMGTLMVSKYFTFIGLVSLGVFVFGIANLSQLLKKYDREIMLALLAYLFLWVVLRLDVFVDYALKIIF